MKLNIKTFLYICLEIVIFILIATFAMIITYSLPSRQVVKNLAKSIDIYESEGLYPYSCGKKIIHSRLDNFTDSIMILEASYQPKKNNIIRSSMMNPFLVSESNKVDTLIKFVKKDKDIKTKYRKYPRYWHGYLTILKPLLIFTDISHIRLFNLYFVSFTFLCVVLLLYKHLGLNYTLAFIFSIMPLNILSISMSFQFQNIYYITMIALIFILSFNKYIYKRNLYPYLFAFIGISVAFFDLLTYPIFALGIPLIIFYLLNRNNKNNIFLDSSILFFSWFMGYIGMWFGKWLVSFMLTGYNTILDALNEVKTRTLINDGLMNKGYNITPFNALYKNISVFFNDPIFIFIFIFILYLFLYHFIKNKSFAMNFSWKTNIFYIICIFIPVIWLMAISGHSFIHFWFTYRILSISIFTILCLLIEIMCNNKSIPLESEKG